MATAKARKSRIISVEELKENLRYNPETGHFTWIKRSVDTCIIGGIAGYINNGYVTIRVNKIAYTAHRLAWLYMTGEMPKSMIDHKDTDRSNNRFSNLRQSTQKQNLQNQIRPKSNNKSGFLGVSYTIRQRFRADIRIDGKTIYLGAFKTAEEAHEAYLIAKRKVHEFCTI